MAWLARLDAKASHWSRPVRWSYLSLKWYLVGSGALCLIWLGVENIRDRTVGIGLAFLVYLAYHIPGAVKRARAWLRHLTDAPLA